MVSFSGEDLLANKNGPKSTTAWRIGKQNVVANGDYGGTEAGGGSRSIAGGKVVMVVTIWWSKVALV